MIRALLIVAVAVVAAPPPGARARPAKVKHAWKDLNTVSESNTVFIKVLPRLSLKGTGCHRDLFGPDGGRICGAVVFDEGFRSCAQHGGWIRRADGGAEYGAHHFGSGCVPPGPRFAALGRGFYFVEEKPGPAYTVLCDDVAETYGDWAKLRSECSWKPDGGTGRHVPALPPGDYD